MSTLVIYNDKLLVKDNKLATSLDCCCEPIKLYQHGGLYYTVGLYASLELSAYDHTNKRVFSWKYCNDIRHPTRPTQPDERGNSRYQNFPNGPGCGFNLKGTFTNANSPAITIRWGGPYGQGDNPNPPYNGTFPGAGAGIVKTVTWADLNFNGVPFCDGPYCPVRSLCTDFCDELEYTANLWPGNNPPTP